MTSIARQWISKHASLTIEAVFFVGSVQSGYKEVLGKKVVDSTLETPACQDMSLGAEELNWVESSEIAVAE
jgi:hypothetical protein